MVTGLAETNAFLDWFSTWGNVVYVIAQLVFWTAIAFAAVMIALQYKRFVDVKAGKAAAKAEKADSKPEIKIDEFVE